MSGGSLGLGLRSASYGSLQQQLHNNLVPNQSPSPSPPPPPAFRKPPKTMKEKEKLFHWICKSFGRKKVGMLFLCVVSAAFFVGVLYMGKGLIFIEPLFSVFYLILHCVKFLFLCSLIYEFEYVCS